MNRILFAALTLVLAGGAYLPTDAERARWTMSDMTSWRTALEAYAHDHGNAYPAASNVGELRREIEGKYMIVAPARDAWGREYRYQRHGDGFRLVSAGADGTFDESTWSTPGRAKSLSDDAVMHEQGFRSWSLE